MIHIFQLVQYQEKMWKQLYEELTDIQDESVSTGGLPVTKGQELTPTEEQQNAKLVCVARMTQY